MDMTYYWLSALGLFGLALGSFAGAQVWRLRARQLTQDKLEGEPYSKTELNSLKSLLPGKSKVDRSRCLHCARQLKWYDLIPLVSWLSTAGRCRYCKNPIGNFEPLMELGAAGFFVVSFLAWPETIVAPLDMLQFSLWLAAGVALAVLFAYDVRWQLLPDVANFSFVGLGLAYALIGLLQQGFTLSAVGSLVGAVAILSGLYLALYWYSSGAWIGFGDVKLGIGLAAFVGTWPMALLALFMANLFGTLVVLPGLLSGRLTRKAHIPFGPFLIGATVVTVLYGENILEWYLGLSVGII